MERTNFADSLHKVLSLLGWSVEDLAGHMKNRYSIAFLQRVCEGRPLNEPERHIVKTVLDALADKVAMTVEESDLSEGTENLVKQAFISVVERVGLRLGDVALFTEDICSKLSGAKARLQTIDVEDAQSWESFLEKMAMDLAQGKLFEEDTYSVLGEASQITTDYDELLLRNRRSIGSGYYPTQPWECWNCRRPTHGLKTTKCDCGVNWNIAN